MTRKLILVKHSMPYIDGTLPANQWCLSKTGEDLCAALADSLRAHAPFRLLSSTEPKAVATAEAVARWLSIETSTATGLHETDRAGVPIMAPDAFEAAVRVYFERREDRVMGAESAGDACKRFTAAVKRIEAKFPDDLALVTHGTVMSLFIAQAVGINAFELWSRLGLPSYCVMEGPDHRLVHIEERLGR